MTPSGQSRRHALLQLTQRHTYDTGIDTMARNGRPPIIPPELIDAPAEVPTLVARDLADEQLITMDHATWLEDYAKIILLPTRIAMTPQRLGTATRVQWSARMLRLLQKTNKEQVEQLDTALETIRMLEARLADADKLLEAAVAKIRRFKWERERAAPTEDDDTGR